MRRRKDGGSVDIVELMHDDMQEDLNRLMALLDVKRLPRFQGFVSGPSTPATLTRNC
jgi:hypothetical protein